MQTFNQSLMQSVLDDQMTAEDALDISPEPKQLLTWLEQRGR